MNLKNQKIPSLDENSQRPQSPIIFVPRNGGSIDSVLAPAGAGDGPSKLELRPVSKLVNQANEGPSAPLFLLLVVVSVDQVLQLGPTELPRPYTEHEADSVHEVGFPGAIGANYRREVVERTDCLLALVRLEVLKLQAEDLPRRDYGRHLQVKSPKP